MIELTTQMQLLGALLMALGILTGVAAVNYRRDRTATRADYLMLVVMVFAGMGGGYAFGTVIQAVLEGYAT